MTPPHAPRHPGPRPRLALLAALLAAACGQAAPVADHGPGLTVLGESTEHFPHYHDFGKVRHGARVQHTFVVHNGDPRPVTVQSIQTACQCTQVKELRARPPGAGPGDEREVRGDPSREGELVVVPAGGELLLTFAVDTGMLLRPNADKLSVVRVRTDSTTPFLTFEMHVLPQKLFELSPPEVRLDEVPVDHGETIAIRILRGDPSFSADVVGIASTGERLSATLQQGFHFEEPVWTVELTVPPGEALGVFQDRLVLTTTDDEGNRDGASLQELPIPVHGRYVENIRLYPTALGFGPLEPGASATIDAYLRTLVPGARVKVLRASVDPSLADHVRVDFRPKAEDGQGRSPVWEIYLHTDGELPPGPFEGTLELALDDAQDPIVQRTFRGEVVAPR